MTSPLLAWLDQPDPGRAVSFLAEDGSWSRFGYSELARGVLGTASWLGECGLRREGVVSLVQRSGPEFISAFFGTLLAGGIPSPAAPPMVLADLSGYIDHLAGILRVADPAVVVCDPEVKPVVAQALAKAGLGLTPLTPPAVGREERIAGSPSRDLALLQFTSGSSGHPRGVRISWSNLEEHVAALRRWLQWSSQDAAAIWLPLYHDMGLVGGLLCSVVSCADLAVMRPEQFIESPRTWLQCMGRLGATMTAGPTFGYAFAAKRVRAEDLEGMDFSNWRVAVLGAERVSAAVLERFTALASPCGFAPEAFLPGYGLAEATLVVTGSALKARPDVVRIDWASLRSGGPITVLERGVLGGVDVAEDAECLVTAGHPLGDTRVDIVDDNGVVLEEGRLGEIVVTGASVARGYHRDVPDAATTFGQDGLHTGDAGFLLDGQLYVVGRIGDSLKSRGRSLYAEDLETRLWALPGIGAGKAVVLLGTARGLPTAAAVVEAEGAAWAMPAARLLRREAGHEVQVRIWTGPRGAILRGSSGKPRRRVMWREIAEDRFPAHLLMDWQAGAPEPIINDAAHA